MSYDFDDNIPIYIQIANLVRLQIISGKLNLGEKIPSVRELALKMKVNPNTISKALAQLEEEKLIFTERTNGKFVTSDKKLIQKIKTKIALDKIQVFLDNMQDIGIDFDEAITYLHDMKGR